jgi:crotonobetainyl-CoA:carnitine CoA-transferase CaiB-like acyl-CoA transferase
VQRLPEVLESEQVRALGMLRQLEHPVAGDTPAVRLPVTLSGAPTTTEAPPPLLGADNERGFG